MVNREYRKTLTKQNEHNSDRFQREFYSILFQEQTIYIKRTQDKYGYIKFGGKQDKLLFQIAKFSWSHNSQCKEYHYNVEICPLSDGAKLTHSK